MTKRVQLSEADRLSILHLAQAVPVRIGEKPLLDGWLAPKKPTDDGTRTHTPITRKQILSLLRLPFRHIGSGPGGTKNFVPRRACFLSP